MFKQIKDLFKKSADSKYSLHKSVNMQGDSVLSAGQYLSINEISLYVNKGINKRADKVGQVEFKVFKGDKEVTEHPILNLLDKPNKEMTGDMFWRLASIYHDVCGFALIRKIGNQSVFSENSKIDELKLLNPAGMAINYDELGKIKSFEVQDYQTAKKETIPFNECIYWVNPNPKKPTEGLSLLRAGLYSIDLDNQLSKYHNAILKNGGSVESVFTFDNILGKEQLDTLKETYREEYSQAEKSGTPLFLGGDAKFQKLGLTPAELSYMDSKKITANDLVVITGVPKSILGLTSEETFANGEISYRIFLRETIKPLIQELVNVLDWQLLPKDLDLTFVDPTPEDTEIKLKTLEIADKVSAMTTNEKREVLGLEPIKGGDEIVYPFNKSPMLPEQKSVKPVFSHPLKNKSYREQYFKYHTKSLESKQNRFNKQLDTYFKGQEKRVLANIDSKKLVMIKKNVGEIFDIELEIKLAYPLLESIKQIAKESGQDVYDMFNLGSAFVYTSSLESNLTNRFEFWSKKINETTADTLTKTLTEWTGNEETLSQLVDRIKDNYNGITEARASTIANTEIGIATQEARLDGYKQMGIPTKVWVWSPGIKGGVRDNHASMDGEEVPVNGFFSNGMRHPLDPNAGAGEICNCECTL
jgi:HK97 family phage portal protein